VLSANTEVAMRVPILELVTASVEAQEEEVADEAKDEARRVWSWPCRTKSWST
jgi:hypothetical protein